MKIKQQPFAQKLKLEDAGDYVMSFSGWSADFPDPITYLDMFVTDGSQNKMKYSNPKYDEIIMKAKKDGSDVNARWKNLLEAEKCYLMMRSFQYINVVEHIYKEIQLKICITINMAAI